MCEGAGKPRRTRTALSISLEGVAAVGAGGGLVARATAASGTGGAEGGSLSADLTCRTRLGGGGGGGGREEETAVRMSFKYIFKSTTLSSIKAILVSRDAIEHRYG